MLGTPEEQVMVNTTRSQYFFQRPCLIHGERLQQTSQNKVRVRVKPRSWSKEEYASSRRQKQVSVGRQPVQFARVGSPK